MADKLEVANDALGALRLKLGKELNLIDESLFNFLWVVGHKEKQIPVCSVKRLNKCLLFFTSKKTSQSVL